MIRQNELEMIQKKAGNAYFKIMPPNCMEGIKNIKGVAVNIAGVKAEFHIGHSRMHVKGAIT
jgi:hypothetical protein